MTGTKREGDRTPPIFYIDSTTPMEKNLRVYSRRPLEPLTVLLSNKTELPLITLWFR